MHYTPSNLPPHYREYFLQTLYSQPSYQAQVLKAQEDTARAGSKLRSVISLKLKQDEFLENFLKQFSTDEEIDEIYKKDHVSLDQVLHKLPNEKKDRFDCCIHAMVFSLDILDTYVSTLNELIHQAYPDHDFALFNNLLATGKQARKLINAFHADKDNEGYAQCFADEADKIQEYIETQRMPVFLRRLARIDKKAGK